MVMSKNARRDELVEAFARSVSPLSPEEQRAGIVLLHELAGGEPVTVTQLGQALGKTVGATAALMKGPALKPFLHADEEGRIVAFFGLTGISTHHQLTINGRALGAWCAVDSLVHPELLGETAAITSRDPETGELIRLTVSATGIEAAEPKGIVVSWVRMDTWDLTSAARTRTSGCHFIFFFASRASAERWQAKHPEKTLLLSLDEAFALGRRINAHFFGVELARRRAEAA
jgi:hypothetical protein